MGPCGFSPKPARRLERGAAAIAVGSTLLLSGAAHAQGAGPPGAGDPFEGFNRAMFGVNQVLDRVLLRPAAETYRRIVPRPIRHVLKNAVSNLGEPAVAVNDALQGHGLKAVKTLTRFAANSTFGLAGLFDPATPGGLPHHDNDFGLTLARYGVTSGPYLFLPLIGPSTVRDGVGEAAGVGLNPLIYIRYDGDAAVGATSFIAGGLQARADADSDLKTLYASATDPYASLRSFYLQNRASQVSGGKLDIQSLPSFDDPAPPDPTPPSPASSSPASPGPAPGPATGEVAPAAPPPPPGDSPLTPP